MKFPVAETPVQVRFSDFDMIGHISHSFYFHYFELGRIDLLKKADMLEFATVIAELNVQFFKEVRSYDVMIESYVTRIGTKSLTVEQRLFADGQHSCTATLQLVGFDMETRKAIALPEGLEPSDLGQVRPV